MENGAYKREQASNNNNNNKNKNVEPAKRVSRLKLRTENCDSRVQSLSLTWSLGFVLAIAHRLSLEF